MIGLIPVDAKTIAPENITEQIGDYFSPDDEPAGTPVVDLNGIGL
jgi:hypothetical protein